MLPDPNNRPSAKYDIAPPLAYDSFQMDADPKHAVSLESETKTSEPQKASWIDKLPDQAAVLPKESRDDFEPPDTPPQFEAESTEQVRDKRAVWIVHGMGQQVPFETLDQITHGLLSVDGYTAAKPVLRTVKIGKEVMQRVELKIDRQPTPQSPARHYELHLYESYWAPKTEGVAKLTDVVSFLWDGGIRGILNWAHKFKRAMFGGVAKFRIRFRTPLWLCITLAVLISLIVINGVVLAAAASFAGSKGSSPFCAHWPELTSLASCMIAVAFSFGAVLFLAQTSKPQELLPPVRVAIGVACWTALCFTVFEILKTAVLMTRIMHDGLFKSGNAGPCGTSYSYACNVAAAATAAPAGSPFACLWHFVNVLRVCLGRPRAAEVIPELQGFAAIIIAFAGILVTLGMIWRAKLQSSEQQTKSNPFLILLAFLALALNIVAIVGAIWIRCAEGKMGRLPGNLCFLQNPNWVWPFLIAFSAAVRKILLQYVGDVAIYIRPNQLDRFDEVRAKIKDAARTVASAVFTAYVRGTNKQFLYKHIAVVGHSLGSVIAYDTLNRLMLDDSLSSNVIDVPGRTRTLVTFGSPLNKTAFLFTIQTKDPLQIRERLASTVQPLILNYQKFRKLKWINVFSKNDIISGRLRFYDLPGFEELTPLPPFVVHNVVDKDAAVPLVAHVAYWKNKTVWKELMAEIAP